MDGIDPGLTIECRGTQISQVILNLLQNAFDAVSSLENKWVRVEVREKQGERVIIAVTDGGPGIPAKIRDRMFEPFYTTKPIGKGTGLGLSITRGIIDSHHGSIVVDADCPNTRIVIDLPRAGLIASSPRVVIGQ